MNYTITIHKRLSKVVVINRESRVCNPRYVYDFSLKVEGRQYWEHGLGSLTRYQAYKRAKSCLKIFYNPKSRFYKSWLKLNPVIEE